jgi:hypothetical protein
MDISVANHGSIFLVTPHSTEAKAWIDENVSEDAQFLGNRLAVEHRFIDNLVEGMRGDGLTVE